MSNDVEPLGSEGDEELRKANNTTSNNTSNATSNPSGNPSQEVAPRQKRTRKSAKMQEKSFDFWLDLSNRLKATGHPKAGEAAEAIALAIMRFEKIYKAEEQVKAGEEARAELERLSNEVP